MRFSSAIGFAATIGLIASQAIATGPEPTDIVEAFMKRLVAGDTSAGFDALMTLSRIDEMKPREIELAKGQTDQMMRLYKKPIGYEKVAVKAFGSSLTRLVYITKHADTALTWNFYFYRAANEWQLLHFDFNDQFQKLE